MAYIKAIRKEYISRTSMENDILNPFSNSKKAKFIRFVNLDIHTFHRKHTRLQKN